MHISWILIIVGAGITRYIGYEGIMPIREGANSNQFLSTDTYVTVLVDGEINGQPRRKMLEKKVLFSEATDFHNKLEILSNFEEFFNLDLTTILMNKILKLNI